MSQRQEKKLLGAWWPQDGNDGKPPAGEGAGLVPVLGADDRVQWGSGSGVGGHWEPVTNGDPDNPEIVFYDGDVLMYWVED